MLSSQFWPWIYQSQMILRLRPFPHLVNGVVPTAFELRTDIRPAFIEYFDKIMKK